MKTLIRFCGIFMVTLVILTALAGVSSQRASAGTVGKVVDIVLLPANPVVNAGATTDITIQVQPNGQDVIGADVFLDFNPAHLEVVTIKPGTTLNTVLQNRYDNAAGSIDYGAGTLNQPYPSATFTLAIITFKAKSGGVSTPIAFHWPPPRETFATSGSSPVLRSASNTNVNIQGGAAPAPTPTATTPPPTSPPPAPTPAPTTPARPPVITPVPTPTPPPAVKPTPTGAAQPAPSPTPSPKPSASPSPSPTPAPASSGEGPNWFYIGGGIAVVLVLGLGIWFALTRLERD